MRNNNYTCDICGEEIIPIRRIISMTNGMKLTSKHESIQQIVFKQIDVESRSYILTNEQESKTYDVCDACWDEVINVLRNRRKGGLNNVYD